MKTAITKCCLLGLLLIFRIDAYTQNQWLDSVKKVLQTEKEDTNKVKALIELARYYVNSHADTGIIYAQKALELAKKLDYENGVLYAEGFLSLTFTFTGNYPLGLDYALKTVSLAKKVDPTARGWAYSTVSYSYYYLGEYETSLAYTREAMKIIQPFELSFGWRDLALVFHKLNEPDSAMLYAKKAYEQFRATGIGNISNVLGEAYAGKGIYDSALVLFHTGISVALREHIKSELIDNYNSIADAYKVTGNLDSAAWYSKNVLNEKVEKSYPIGLLKAANMLAAIYESLNKPDSTLKYLRIAINLKDSLFSREKTMAIQNLAFKEQEKQKEIEASDLKYQNRLKTYFLLGGLIALLVIAGILLRNNRNKQKANALLQQQKQKVESTLVELKSTQSQLIQSEKMASLGELTAGIAHEIQNPLNFVNNFSEINTELIDDLKQEALTGNLDNVITIAGDIMENEQKINHHGKRADAIVKGMLQHSKSSSGIKEPADINTLADEYFRLSYHGIRSKDKNFNAAIQTDFDHSIGKINIIPPDIGRVLLNLYNNAFYAVNEKKNASPGSAANSYEPTVLVSTKKDGDKVIISVKDNGNGIPQNIIDKIFQPFFTTKPTGQGTGLGLSLSYDIIKAHGGEIKVNTKENEGTIFTISLPV